MKCIYCDTALVLVYAKQEKDKATIVVSCACSTYADYPVRVVIDKSNLKDEV